MFSICKEIWITFIIQVQNFEHHLSPIPPGELSPTASDHEKYFETVANKFPR